MSYAASVGRDAAEHYLPLAAALAEGRYGEAFDAGIPPLYPLVGGLVGSVVGDVELGCRLVSVAAGVAVVVLIFLLGRRLFGPWAGLLGAALVGFHPYQARFSADVGPDMLAVALLVGAAWAVVEYLRACSLGRAAVVGALLALLALTRLEGFAYAVPALGLMVLFPAGDGFRVWRRRLVHGLVLVFVAAVLCLPRLLWVYQQSGQWVIDTRQITWPARFWHAVMDRSFRYGQLGLWQRGGLKAAADSLEVVAASFGPATLLLGVYAIWRRPRDPGSRLQWAPGLLMLFGVVLVLLGRRLAKRYLLGPGALGQVWGGAGLAMLTYVVVARLGRSGKPVRRPAAPYIVAACLALLQLPWALASLHGSHQAERLMGQWILEHFGPGRRVIAPDSIPTWYAQATHLSWPSIRRPDRCRTILAQYAGKVKAELIIVDHRLVSGCPEVLADIGAGAWRYGAMVYQVQEGSRTLSLLEFRPPAPKPRKEAASRPAAKVRRPPRAGGTTTASSRPARRQASTSRGAASTRPGR